MQIWILISISVDKTDSLITCKTLKLFDNMSNQFNHYYSLIFIINYARNAIQDVFKC